MASLATVNEFQHILRLLNTNVDGRVKIMYALTAIKGIGRRFSNIVCKKAEVDMKKRAGECSAEELERLMTIVANPANYKIPTWFLNRQKDYKTGRFTQAGLTGPASLLQQAPGHQAVHVGVTRCPRGLRTYWGLRVRGQHTKTTGRAGKTMAAKKK
ncbi:component of cytosolic 80S ribosome and 40S small subunit [Haematococcus lacustris]